MKALLAMVCVSLWVVTWSALLADKQARFDKGYAVQEYRHHLGGCMLFALFPPFWVVTPFLTGFYENGFQFGPTRPMDRGKP